MTGSISVIKDFPKESIRLYQRMNSSAPHRSINLLGLAKSYNQSGNTTEARRLYELLLNQMDNTTTGNGRRFIEEVVDRLQSVSIRNRGHFYKINFTIIFIVFMIVINHQMSY